MDDDFESHYAEELEMLQDEEGMCEAAPPSRRALSLATPDLPPGAARKRPIEESPLPGVPSDSDDTPGLPCKVPRLMTPGGLHDLPPISEEKEEEKDEDGVRDSSAVADSSQFASDRATRTPVRHSTSERIVTKGRIISMATRGSGDGGSPSALREALPVRPYSPPSPYALSPSPSPSSSPPPSPRLTQEHKRRRIYPEASGNMGAHGSVSMSQGSPQRRGVATPTATLTPKRRAESATKTFPTTPDSGSKYRRVLVPSQTSEGENGLPHRSPRSLMERFEATYRSLKDKPPGVLPDNISGLSDSEDKLDQLSMEPVSPDELDGEYSLSSTSRPATAAVEARHRRTGVLTRAPACPHVTVTGTDGKRVFLRLRSRDKDGTDSTSRKKLSKFQLLSVPFARLRESVEEERRRKLIERSDNLLRSLTSRATDEESQSLFGDSEVPDPFAPGAGDPRTEQSLWVDKYSPRNFTELLSDDGINRTLLSWLKLWDETVFGRSAFSQKGVKKPEEKGWKGAVHGAAVGAGRGRGGKNERGGGGGGFRVDYRDPSAFAEPEALDETKRPKLKLALLCGAPGLGKTTLSHVIAKHAGYNVVEMNASDDRSPEVFKERIESATQMQAVLTRDSRPNCLIIDEIDGAPTAAINVLIDAIKKKEPNTSKKKKRKAAALSRPIICICNDQYAPSLRQLRQYALVLHFPTTVSSRLAARLHRVVREESMIASMATLMALSEKTDNDIRACLNTLQFIHRNHSDLTLAAVQNASVGQKDAQRSLFSLWKEIFHLSSAKRSSLNQQSSCTLSGVLEEVGRQTGRLQGDSGPPDRHLSANATRFYHMFAAASATGEFEKVAQGLFENYPHIRFRDPNLEAVSLAQDWMVFHDTVQTHIHRSQNYSATVFLPYLSVAFHFLFAAPSKPPIRYPHTGYEVFQRHQRSSFLVSSLLVDVRPHVKRNVNTRLLATEMLSPLLKITSPTFRPVSIQLYSPREKQQLADLVDTMISYNLTYKQEKALDGQYTYILDPNVDELCRYPGLPQRKQLSYSAKQLIAREIEVEKMRRAERALTSKASSHTEKASSESQATEARASSGTSPLAPKKATAGHKFKQLPTVKRERPTVDFFGRTTVAKAQGKSSASSAATHPLWFRFNEGFSNAVKRPVRIQDLL